MWWVKIEMILIKSITGEDFLDRSEPKGLNFFWIECHPELTHEKCSI